MKLPGTLEKYLKQLDQEFGEEAVLPFRVELENVLLKFGYTYTKWLQRKDEHAEDPYAKR